jgi:hypothetical protein
VGLVERYVEIGERGGERGGEGGGEGGAKGAKETRGVDVASTIFWIMMTKLAATKPTDHNGLVIIL